MSRPGDRITALDGQRAFAVLGALVFSVYQFCNVGHYLYLGTPAYTILNSLDAMIPWLFVLNGFLLFVPMARAVVDGHRPAPARSFLARRAIRLLPVYYVAVAVVWFLRQSSLPGDWRDLVEHVTFTQVFDDKRIFWTIGPAWAVSVAVFFYLALALLSVGLGAICQRHTSRRWRVSAMAGAALILALISLTWKAWAFGIAHRSTLGSFTTWFGPLANLDTFAVGMGVAIVAALMRDLPAVSKRRRSGLQILGSAVLGFAFATRQPNTWSAVYFSTMCAVGFGCWVAAAVLRPAGRHSRHAISNPLPWLGGTIAFSIYVWQEPILLALRGWNGLVRQSGDAFVHDTIVVLVISTVFGWLSYVLVERPTSQLRSMVERDDDPGLRSAALDGWPSEPRQVAR